MIKILVYLGYLLKQLMNKSLFYLLVYFISICSLFAQKENFVWAFGNSSGLDFSTNPPTAIHTNIGAFEGCASVADANGNLMFYTNGENVYNKNHTLMLNGTGINGHINTSQIVIAKKPKSETIYYIFHTPSQGDGNLAYSEVDMTLDGGLGGITTNKNINLFTRATERMTSVMHQNNVDVWVITQNFVEFKAFLITCNGIKTTPISSPMFKPVQLIDDNYQAIGQMKISPNGLKLACTFQQNDVTSGDTGRIELYNFDRSKGKVDTAQVFYNLLPYGLEFSPSNEFMYVSTSVSPTNAERNSNVFQYNITLATTEEIDSTKLIVSENKNIGKGALQLAPNQQIYVAIPDFTYTSVIQKPDNKGADCQYFLINVPLLPLDSMKLGLPQKIALPIMDTITICENEVFIQNNKTYSLAGIYRDSITSTSCDSILFYFELKVKKLPQLNEIDTLIFCDSIILPEIKGTNLTGNEAYFTKKNGFGTRYEIGDTLYNFTPIFFYDASLTTCFDEKELNIKECFAPFPNIFTPNNDGINDVFKVKLPDASKYDFIVFNRWGRVVYSQEGYTNDWSGGELPDGQYYYIFTHQELRESWKGIVQLNR